MKFDSAILARFDGLRATLVAHDGHIFPGSIAVNPHPGHVNIDRGRGYDVQVEAEGFAACLFELASDQRVPVPDAALAVELELGANVAIRGQLIEENDGVLLLAGEIAVRATPLDDASSNDGATAASPTTTSDMDWKVYSGCVCVVDRSKVTSGLPDASDDDSGTIGCA